MAKCFERKYINCNKTKCTRIQRGSSKNVECLFYEGIYMLLNDNCQFVDPSYPKVCANKHKLCLLADFPLNLYLQNSQLNFFCWHLLPRLQYYICNIKLFMIQLIISNSYQTSSQTKSNKDITFLEEIV